MTSVLWALAVCVTGIYVLGSVAPALSHLASLLTPLVLVAGVFALAWRMLDYLTRR